VDGDTAVVELTEVNWTLMEAIRTPIFWIVALGIAWIAMLSTGLHFHMVSICQDNDLTPTVAAAVYVPLALTSALVNLGSGVLVDRIPVRVLLAAALVFQAISLPMAQFLTGVEMAFVYGVILGATLGLQLLVSSVIWAMYFGRRHLGSITGATTTIMVVGSALGPMPLGVARDLLGTYNLALTVSMVPTLILGVVSIFADRPRKQ
jgi:sugar phosphate permease